MRKTFKILAIILLIQSCRGQEKNEKMITNGVNYNNGMFRKTYNIISKKVEQCFEKPSDEIFRDRIKEIFKIDIEKSEFIDVELSIKDYPQVAIKKHNLIIPTTSDLPSDKRREKEDFETINKIDEKTSLKICKYNNMLFNDDLNSTNWYKVKHPFEIIDLVQQHGYTANKNWLQFAFSKSKLYEPEVLIGFLFDAQCKGEWRGESGDCNTISTLRKDMLDKMIDYGAELSQLHTVANMVSNGNQELYKESTKETYAYLMAHCYAAGQSGMIEYLYDKNPKMKEVFRKNNYYNIEGLAKYTNEIYLPKDKRFGIGSTDPDPYLGYGVINDPDGYSNLREGKGTNHPIVKKIVDGEKFAIERKESDWWLVVTENGTSGWIHKSRVKIIRE